MQAQLHKNDVLVSVAGCAIVDGDQAIQELTWALLQAQQTTIKRIGSRCT